VSGQSGTPGHGMGLRQAFGWVAGLTALLWLIHIVDFVLGLDLQRYGVYPRTLEGIRGIVLAPLIHGSFAHIVANTLPLLILGTALLYGYPRSSRIMVPVIWLLSGLGVWLFARESLHFGASGLTFGFMFFVFVIGALRWDAKAIALSCIVFFMYGSMIWGIFPTAPNVSFEYHFFGAAVGVAGAVLLRRLDPKPTRRRYDWEDESEGTQAPWSPDDWHEIEDRLADDDNQPEPPTRQ
jgi:membrane associated rhomboid family serine protease